MAIRAHRMAGRAAGVSPASREGAPNRTQNVFVDPYANCVLIQARASAGCPDTSRQPSPQPPLAAPVALSGFGFVVAYECETVPYAQVPCDGLCPSVDARHCASRWPRPGCPQANDSDAAPQLRSHRQECRARQTTAVGGENINFDDLAPPRGRAGEGGPVANTGARIERGSDQPSHAAAGPSPPVGRPPHPLRSAQPRASRSSTDKRLGGDPHEPARPVVAGAVQEGLALRPEVDRWGGDGGRGTPSNQRILTLYAVPHDSAPGAAGGCRTPCLTCPTTLCVRVWRGAPRRGYLAHPVALLPRARASTTVVVGAADRCWLRVSPRGRAGGGGICYRCAPRTGVSSLCQRHTPVREVRAS